MGEFKKLHRKECYNIMNTTYSIQISSYLIWSNDEIPIQVYSFLEGNQRFKFGGVMRAIK